MRCSKFLHSTRTSWSRKTPRHRQGRAPARQAQPPLYVVTSLPRTVSARTINERVYLPEGQHGERHLGTAARPVQRPHLHLPLPRQPAPALLLRPRLHPLRRPAARATGHPPDPRHRRHSAPQAAQGRSTRDDLGAQDQGRHGLRTPFRSRLRPCPRPTIRVETASTRTPPHAASPAAEGPVRPLTSPGLANLEHTPPRSPLRPTSDYDGPIPRPTMAHHTRRIGQLVRQSARVSNPGTKR